MFQFECSLAVNMVEVAHRVRHNVIDCGTITLVGELPVLLSVPDSVFSHIYTFWFLCCCTLSQGVYLFCIVWCWYIFGPFRVLLKFITCVLILVNIHIMRLLRKSLIRFMLSVIFVLRLFQNSTNFFKVVFSNIVWHCSVEFSRNLPGTGFKIFSRFCIDQIFNGVWCRSAHIHRNTRSLLYVKSHWHDPNQNKMIISYCTLARFDYINDVTLIDKFGRTLKIHKSICYLKLCL